MMAMGERGIETRPVFYPMHQMPAFYEKDGQYPVADRESALGISLPTHAELEEADIQFIVDSLRACISKVPECEY
jgi:perosamine synthetase